MNFEKLAPEYQIVKMLHRLADHGAHVPGLAFVRSDVALATLRQRRVYG